MEERKSIQPFKTISLVDRLKGTIYDKDPESATLSNKPQGSPKINTIPTSQNKDSDELNLPKAQLTLPKEGALLKNLPVPETKDSVILKGLADGPQAQYPIARPTKFLSLANSTIPSARTRFASTLSLANRLKQPNSETGAPWVTTALPQYFLSDLHTGYLEISRLITPPIGFTQNTTRTELPISTTDILKIQDPDTPTTARVEDNVVLVGQGTFFTNGDYVSVIETENRINNDTVLQLQGTFFTNGEFVSLASIETPVVLIDQGEVSLPIWNYVTNQGEVTFLSEQVDDTSMAVLQGMLISNGLIIGSIVNPENLETISLENSIIPSLDIIAYQTDRLLAFAAPKIKHGSGLIEVTRHDGDVLKAAESPETKHGATEGLNTPTDPKDIDNIAVGNNKALLDQIEPGERVDTEAGETPTPFPKVIGDGFLKASVQQFTPNRYQTQPGEEGELKQTGKSKNRAEVDGFIKTFGEQSEGKKLDVTELEKGLPISFHPEGGKPIKVPCYLTSFSDGFGASWNDVNYVGRQDTLKQFKGVTRALSFALLVPSFSQEELYSNMAMLNKLADATVIGTMSGKYIKGPLCKLKIGNLINSYCAFSSMKWDFDPAEATMDIDEHLPHMLKVSFEAAVLADRNDKLLGSKSGDYFGSIY